jgi:hypothetical protein
MTAQFSILSGGLRKDVAPDCLIECRRKRAGVRRCSSKPSKDLKPDREARTSQ